ncbi:hypothetical protein HOLleu_19570 [Holothuria leucospilota]|uniref:Uncharacterized protein n=1 Tax=Holothuria leucospilota TaxID=206669 RepID=A0A9Q1H7A6_HOLLE|nr:hypothetical protein HOLleu_19570 [Holothuria leucospilota]
MSFLGRICCGAKSFFISCILCTTCIIGGNSSNFFAVFSPLQNMVLYILLCSSCVLSSSSMICCVERFHRFELKSDF